MDVFEQLVIVYPFSYYSVVFCAHTYSLPLFILALNCTKICEDLRVPMSRAIGGSHTKILRHYSPICYVRFLSTDENYILANSMNGIVSLSIFIQNIKHTHTH